MEMDGWVDGWMDGVKGPSRRPCSSFSRLRLLKFSRLPPHFYIFFFLFFFVRRPSMVRSAVLWAKSLGSWRHLSRGQLITKWLRWLRHNFTPFAVHKRLLMLDYDLQSATPTRR